MKKLIIIAFVIILYACSSSQFTMYKADNDSSAWKVKVTKKPVVDAFTCTINDSVVVEDSFGLFESNFEKDGTYNGKKVKMSGHKTDNSIIINNGTIIIDCKYQVRVFIDEQEVTKFDF